MGSFTMNIASVYLLLSVAKNVVIPTRAATYSLIEQHAGQSFLDGNSWGVMIIRVGPLVSGVFSFILLPCTDTSRFVHASSRTTITFHSERRRDLELFVRIGLREF
jgi:hypothetical protein